MKWTVVDAKGHLKGRLSACVAKQLLKGNHIVIIRAEEVNISGGMIRNKLKFLKYLAKTMRSNPSRGPTHYRAPSMILYKSIRGMLPHKHPRGVEALNRLRIYEGCPPTFEKKKKMVIPDALRIVNLDADSKYIRLGDLSTSVGWKYAKIIESLEKKRISRGHGYFAKKQALLKKRKGVLTAGQKEKAKKKTAKTEDKKKIQVKKKAELEKTKKAQEAAHKKAQEDKKKKKEAALAEQKEKKSAKEKKLSDKKAAKKAKGEASKGAKGAKATKGKTGTKGGKDGKTGGAGKKEKAPKAKALEAGTKEKTTGSVKAGTADTSKATKKEKAAKK